MKKQIKIFYLFLVAIISTKFLYAQPPAPPNIPRITPKAIKSLIFQKRVKYVFIDSSTFGNSHVCGAIYISHTWCPPYGKERIKNIRIPKDYYIFCYCT